MPFGSLCANMGTAIERARMKARIRNFIIYASPFLCPIRPKPGLLGTPYYLRAADSLPGDLVLLRSLEQVTWLQRQFAVDLEHVHAAGDGVDVDQADGAGDR